MSQEHRDLILKRMEEDLVGPLAIDEVLDDRPTDRYLTGILFPQRSKVPDEENEELRGGEEDAEDTTDAAPEAIPLTNVMRPATAGISFAVRAAEEPASVSFRVRCGTYTPFWLDEEGKPTSEPGMDYEAKWRRVDHVVDVPETALRPGAMPGIDLAEHGLDGLSLRLQVATAPDCLTVTAVLVNRLDSAETRLETEKRTFFQVELVVQPGEGSELVARPSRKSGEEAEFRLIYRHCREYAVGHTCSARWTVESDERVREVATDWIPHRQVAATSAEGDPCFEPLRKDPKLSPLSAEWLATTDRASLLSGLRMLPQVYSDWLQARESEIPALDADLQPQARDHIRICREACRRMEGSIELLEQDPNSLAAFRYANRAMAIQRRWTRSDPDLNWRPFQLGFQLLALQSIAMRTHDDRGVMDLLWFPTGGGKTEAYLGLVAFTLFHRRLSEERHGDGAGVGVIMRYTLRLLTIQQFQRAASLIAACEYMRRGNERPEPSDLPLGDGVFSIGLWVGGGATPNKVAEAAERLGTDDDPTPCQIKVCPACRSERIEWACVYRGSGQRRKPDHIVVKCTNPDCAFGGSHEPHLPVYTVDEDIYRAAPSLLIGTVDKFAQIARKPGDTAVFFGRDAAPPDLIIQDELHLIAGPLGTVAGLYEIAIDELCSRTVQSPDGDKKVVPKIIGSTATIRRASEQIASLFNRETSQFPPPVLSADNSCFAVKDTQRPGRLYAGITSAGRSPKFALQAVCGTLLQAASSPGITPDSERDPWWTELVYFNSLRELGGALVMMQDDVPASIGLYAALRNEPPRPVETLDELTSRKRQVELRDTLHALEHPCTSGQAFDSVLATNMISVGVDVPRLSLMVVNGQPKQIAEYIQATSRVGREYPGLIVTVYNAGRARDRSHFETFPSWHAAPYRDVEATSVTPFASRAQDKALHAVLVSLVRHRFAALRDSPVLPAATRMEIENQVMSLIVARANAVDPEEVAAVRQKLRDLLDQWEARCSRWSAASTTPAYWLDHQPHKSLLMSAEQYAARAAAGWSNAEVWSTPNSMRDVEPGTPFKLIPGIKKPGGSTSAG